MAIVGYARASSANQMLAVQLDKLQHCDKIFQEMKCSTNGKRPQLESCLEFVREGDTLMVTSLSSLARSTLHLCQITAELERKRVHLQVLDQNMNTRDATGRFLFDILDVIAQFEMEIRAERQRDGIQKAKKRGVRLGKRKKLNSQQIAELQTRRNEGVLIKTLMRDYGISKSSVYRYLNYHIEAVAE